MTVPIIPILGIDPGFTGGWAVVDHQYKLVDAGPMPVRKRGNVSEINARALADVIEGTKARVAYVEFVISRPRQAGQFRFGQASGVVHGVIETLGLKMEMVAAAKWKMGVGLTPRAEDETTSEHKKRSRALASKIWPDQAHRFSRTMDDGVAEAALIAFYGVAREQE